MLNRGDHIINSVMNTLQINCLKSLLGLALIMIIFDVKSSAADHNCIELSKFQETFDEYGEAPVWTGKTLPAGNRIFLFESTKGTFTIVEIMPDSSVCILITGESSKNLIPRSTGPEIPAKRDQKPISHFRGI